MPLRRERGLFPVPTRPPSPQQAMMEFLKSVSRWQAMIDAVQKLVRRAGPPSASVIAAATNPHSDKLKKIKDFYLTEKAIFWA